MSIAPNNPLYITCINECYFFSNMLIFNSMFYDLFDKKRTIYISNRSLFKNIIKDYFKLFYNY